MRFLPSDLFCGVYVWKMCYFSGLLYSCFQGKRGESENRKKLENGHIQAGKKYFGCSKPSFSAQQAGKTIRVQGNTETKHSAMGRYFLKPINGWELEASFTAKQRNYPKHVRLIKRLKDIGLKE